MYTVGPGKTAAGIFGSQPRAALLAGALALVGCQSGQVPPACDGDARVSGQRIAYSDGLHNENTELLTYKDHILLAFRGGEISQIGSSDARIKLLASGNGGVEFAPLAEVSVPERDIRDPKLILDED